MKKVLAPTLVVLLMATAAFAQKPVRNVSPSRHPNLAAAQKFATDAYDKIVAAQRANEFDMKGHAQKAKELLEQVNNELKQAAEAANQNK
jgi:F0F1-type ATP synthase membrane subunit b/b'